MYSSCKTVAASTCVRVPCQLAKLILSDLAAGGDRGPHLLVEQRQPGGGDAHLPHCPLPALHQGQQSPLHLRLAGQATTPAPPPALLLGTRQHVAPRSHPNACSWPPGSSLVPPCLSSPSQAPSPCALQQAAMLAPY